MRPGSRPSAQEAAHELLGVVPRVMAVIRAEVRRQRACDISVPQLRTLGYLEGHADTSLTEVADFIGLTLPSMSKLVDGLVERSLARRVFDAVDRRRMRLGLTAEGQEILKTARAQTQAALVERLAPLSAEERRTIVEALRLLEPLFAPEGDGQPERVGAAARTAAKDT